MSSLPGNRLRTLLPAVLLALVAGGCGSDGDGDAPGGAEARLAVKTLPVPVAVAVLEEGRVEDAVRAWGTVRPLREAQILSELSGRVSAVHVALGDAVEQNRILLEIDPELYLARVEEAESGLESTRIAKERAKKELERRKVLFEKGTVSDSELEGAATLAAQAEASHAAARAALAQTQKDLSGARLRAPFPGHIATRPPDPGSTVSPGMPLVSVVAIDRLRVETLLSEQDLARTRAGSPASIRVDAVPGRAFPGKVLAIGPETDPQTKQFPVEIEVENPPGHPLRGGMVARVEIAFQTYEKVPLLPVDALVESPEGFVFYTVEDGVARLRRLTPGPRTGQHIGVLGGAAAGDTVVVLGQVRLADGSAVRIEEIR